MSRAASQLPRICAALRPRPRTFTVLHPSSYNGVYKELTTMKLQKPWLQALAERNAGIKPSPPPIPAGGLSPKRMSDSYHKLVRLPPPPTHSHTLHANTHRSSRYQKTNG